MRARVFLVALAAACTRQASIEHANERSDASVADVAPPPQAEDAGDAAASRETLGTLGGHPEIVELCDGEEKLGVVSVPLGAHEPRPVVIALHGGSERPERACPEWRIATDAHPFVVCPRGWGGNER